MVAIRRRDAIGFAAVYDDGDDELGQECEAFLAGDYVAWREVQGLPVPGWARLNRVAHGHFDEIVRDLDGREVPTKVRSYSEAAVVVEAILVAVTSPEELDDVQRTTLVPLELRAMAGDVSPRAAVEEVVEAVL